LNKGAREKTMEACHGAASAKTALGGIDREYTLGEVATITRASTAKVLGLKNKGHLGVGADADLAIYRYVEGHEHRSFSKTRYTIKDGQVVCRDGEVVRPVQGRTFWVSPPGEMPDEVKEGFPKFYTISMENYGVQDEYLPKGEVVPCG
jgi:formylmethanofuran dehydrogenase subunit A